MKSSMFNTLFSMKKIALLLLFTSTAVFAQTDLTGRVYYNANVTADKMDEIIQKAKKESPDAKAEAIKKAEEKKKRKLTEEEKAKVLKEAEEAEKLGLALIRGIRTALTVTFKDKETLVAKMEMKIDEEVLKKNGIGWAKRKLLQAATAISPSEKSKYTVSGNMIITSNGNEKDTMYLSNDGKYLSGMMDEETPFKLTRTK